MPKRVRQMVMDNQSGTLPLLPKLHGVDNLPKAIRVFVRMQREADANKVADELQKMLDSPQFNDGTKITMIRGYLHELRQVGKPTNPRNDVGQGGQDVA